MEAQYHPKTIEAATQTEWASSGVFRVVENAKDKNGEEKPKFYACSMLPYPSGKLHMGHVRNYTINDVMLRYLRMNGYNVLMPMGWDAFGLPAENAAIANHVPPAQWTYANIADMKAQMQPLGLAFDWSREVTTCRPEYYKWNQWLFLKMLETGVAYRNTQVVNWDPVDQTVLANEQVIDGRGWRSGALVEKREIPGYYLRITQYAEELLDHVVNKLPGWPERVRLMQENWIGKSVGAEIHFPYDEASIGKAGALKVFTTRPDTVYGATFVAVAPEHALANQAAVSNPALAAFIDECRKGGVTEAQLATQEKKGLDTGLFVVHPLMQKKLPVWVGNYVLMAYGEGAVMGVPAHDERDFAFAKKYGLDIVQVVQVEGKPYSTDAWQDWYVDDGAAINSEDFNGLVTAKFKEKIGLVLAALDLGGPRTTYRLRDWSISRQRYWGTPIPIIHCDTCGAVPVPEKDLPVVLPEDLVPDGSGSPLKKDERFLKCDCPACGKPAERETDTLDTFVDSAWYYMRYCSPDATGSMVDARNDYWMPMDQYIGGIEHAVLHLLYARFWTKVMRDLKGGFPGDPERGLVKFDEPFTNLFTQGMLSKECFFREDASGKKRWYYPDEIDVRHDDKGRPTGAVARDDGLPVVQGGIEKMSKSKNNVVEPKDIIDRFGADTARAYVMFAGPPDQSAAWADSGAKGVFLFLHRLWAYAYEHHQHTNPTAAAVNWNDAASEVKKLRHTMHVTLKQANFDYQRLHYNTVVSAAMIMLNALEKVKTGGDAKMDAARAEGLSILIRMLYPVAPHITHRLWQDLGYAALHGDILDAQWPQPDPVALDQDEIEMVVQVSGKLRGSIRVPKAATKEAIEQLALIDAGVQRHTEGKPIKRIIVVPGRLVNVVV